MTKEETLDLLNYIKATAPKFYNVPSASVNSWHVALGGFSKREAVDAADFIVRNSKDSPAVSSIKAYCDRQRYNARRQQQMVEGDNHMRQATESFRDVPGDTRFKNVLYTCAQRAAEHWINGETENEFYGDILLNAKSVGVTFEGVDYSSLKNSGSGISEVFLKMAVLRREN